MASFKMFSVFETMRTYRAQFDAYLRDDRRRLYVAYLLIAGIAVTNTLLIWLIGMPFNLLSAGDYDSLMPVLGWLLLVVLMNQSMHFGSTLLANGIGLRFVGRVRNALLSHLLYLSEAGLQKYQKGDVLARLSHDVDKVQRLLVELPLFMLSHFFTFTFYCVMLIFISWKLALLAGLLTPLFLIHQRIFAPRKQKAAEAFLNRNGRLLCVEEETLSAVKGISSFNAESRIAHLHSNVFQDAFRWAMRERWIDTSFNTSLSFLVYFCGIVVFSVGLYSVQQQTMMVGELLSFILYLGYLSVPMRGFSALPFEAKSNEAAASRINELFELQSILSNEPQEALRVTQGDIRFENVSFAYAEQAVLFNDLSFHIKPHQSVAIVGRSGVGKSTIAKLLVRFYDPISGRITIDGQSLNLCTPESIRQNVAVVWQQPTLLDDTLRNNLLMACPDATEETLISACEASYAWEFVSRLPQGLDTQVGANGVSLSIGQQQRLAIAQAFLRDAPILILDEASSALDSLAEQELLQALAKLQRGRTTITIAHRYSSIRNADRVLYLNSDGTATLASHDELLKSHEEYRQAVAWQFGTNSL